MAAQIIQLVNDLTGQGRFEEAQAVLRRLDGESPGNPQVQYELGKLAYVLGRYAEAEEYLRSSLAIRTDIADSHYQMGLIHLKLNQPAEAMSEFRCACEINSSFALGHLHWGLSLALMGNYRGALGQFNQALKINPQLSVANYQAGLAAIELEQWMDALQYFELACRQQADFAEALNGLGVTMLALKRPAEALKYFEQAGQIDQRMYMHRQMAQALLALGRRDEVTRHYQAALSGQAPDVSYRQRALIYNDWAVELCRQGQMEAAMEKLRQAIDVDDDLLQAQLNMALLQIALKEFDQANESFARLLDRANNSPLTPSIVMYAGVALLLSGRYAEALAKFKQVPQQSEQSGQTPGLSLWMGYTEIALGDNEAALYYFEGACRENPQNYQALDGWGCCLAETQRHQQAIEKFRQAISIKPDFALARWHLARSLEARNYKVDAQNEYQQALHIDAGCLQPIRESVDALLARSQYDLALQQSLKLLQITPYDLEAQLRAAIALRYQNRIDECYQLLNRVLVAEPSHGGAQALLGQVYLSQGKLLEADERFRVATQLGETDAAIYFSWGKTLLLLGMHEMALEKFITATQIDPYDADSYEAWGSTLKQLGRFQEAGEVYKRAAEYI